MPLTLEERERLAYITNAPEHPLIVLALDGEEEQREEIARLEGEIKQAEADNDKLTAEKEKLEEQVGDLEEKLGFADDTVAELRDQIHKAGVDLV